MLSAQTNLKSIGGYIELDLPLGNEFHQNLRKLNTGRNALEYILRIKKYNCIFLPYFTCDVLLEPITKLKIKYRFYHIDQNFEPIIDFDLGPDECFLYTNYFGIKQSTVRRLSKQISNLVIDNSQAFFSKPVSGVDTFYSCRKFFGVPDGSYLQICSKKILQIEQDTSVDRFSHLIKSIDLGKEQGYSDYVANNAVLSFSDIKEMSALTAKIMSGIDYNYCQTARNRNYSYLHKYLQEFNDLPINADDPGAPMAYPFLSSKPDIKERLIENKIFIATYWPNVFDWTSSSMYENYLASHLVSLPVDHRYNVEDMKRILEVLMPML